MITPSREKGQHLKFEDRVSIKIYRKLKYTLRAIADVLDCSPSTITTMEWVVLCQDLVQHKMRNFNYFQLTNSDSLATLAL